MNPENLGTANLSACVAALGEVHVNPSMAVWKSRSLLGIEDSSLKWQPLILCRGEAPPMTVRAFAYGFYNMANYEQDDLASYLAGYFSMFHEGYVGDNRTPSLDMCLPSFRLEVGNFFCTVEHLTKLLSVIRSASTKCPLLAGGQVIDWVNTPEELLCPLFLDRARATALLGNEMIGIMSNPPAAGDAAIITASVAALSATINNASQADWIMLLESMAWAHPVEVQKPLVEAFQIAVGGICKGAMPTQSWVSSRNRYWTQILSGEQVRVTRGAIQKYSDTYLSKVTHTLQIHRFIHALYSVDSTIPLDRIKWDIEQARGKNCANLSAIAEMCKMSKLFNSRFFEELCGFTGEPMMAGRAMLMVARRPYSTLLRPAVPIDQVKRMATVAAIMVYNATFQNGVYRNDAGFLFSPRLTPRETDQVNRAVAGMKSILNDRGSNMVNLERLGTMVGARMFKSRDEVFVIMEAETPVPNIMGGVVDAAEGMTHQQIVNSPDFKPLTLSLLEDSYEAPNPLLQLYAVATSYTSAIAQQVLPNPTRAADLGDLHRGAVVIPLATLTHYGVPELIADTAPGEVEDIQIKIDPVTRDQVVAFMAARVDRQEERE